MKIPEMILDSNTTQTEMKQDYINLLLGDILVEECNLTDLDDAFKCLSGTSVDEIFMNAKDSRDKLLSREEKWNEIIVCISGVEEQYRIKLTLLESFIKLMENNIKHDEKVLESLLVLAFRK